MPVRLYDHQLKRELYRKNDTFSKNVRFLRLANGYSQEKMADQFHMARSTYYAMEQGGSTPHFELAAEIADFYEVDLDYLISYDIAQQLLALIRPHREDVKAIKFIEKWLSLSQAGKDQIVSEINQIYSEEKRYRRFPWKYVDTMYELKDKFEPRRRYVRKNERK